MLEQHSETGLYIQLYSVHGLIRAHDLEMGHDSDTGGQVKYVLELAKALSLDPRVRKVELFTRLISDRKVSADYSRPREKINDKAEIIRLTCGGTRYLKKETLWPYLAEFVDSAIRYVKQADDLPDIIHSHYADAGYVCSTLASVFGIPMIHTAHSLGKIKEQKLLRDGLSAEQVERRFNMKRRIEIEERALQYSSLIITSTQQEISEQWSEYENSGQKNFSVIPPGIDTSTFSDYREARSVKHPDTKKFRDANLILQIELRRFFANQRKPLILTLCRPDKKKNIPALIKAYGEDPELQKIANLAVFAGIRKDISNMDKAEQEVLTEILLLMDRYDLYGNLAIPKKHNFSFEVPELYRFAAETGGVFVNPAFTEPFGLTLIEAAASGLPLVATNDGGPNEIIQNTESGILVDVTETKNISMALKRILKDKVYWHQLSENGVRGIKKFYTWDSHADSYLSAITEVIRRQKVTPKQSLKKERIGIRFQTIKKALITDIDHTLVGDDKSMAELIKWLKEHEEEVLFGVATGREPELTKAIFKEMNLPYPDLMICSVGSEIFYGENLLPDAGYRKSINYRWFPDRIRTALADIPYLQMQEPDRQRKHKISYYHKQPELGLKEINKALAKHNAYSNLIFSHNRFLDCLPIRASKGKAIRYLAVKWDIPINKMVVAGDSGNDFEMLTGQTKAIVVGNYSDELLPLKNRSSVYFSEYNYAQGIIDGLEYFKFKN